MNCQEVRPYLQAFVDDELSPERIIDVQCHLKECTECAAEVELTKDLCCATRDSVTRAQMCPDFRLRLQSSLSEERKLQETHSSAPLSWKVIVPLAAAALMAFVIGMDDSSRGGQVVRASLQNNVVDFLVQNHAFGREPEMRERQAVTRWESRLGFPVRAPNLERYGAHFEGANIVPLNRTQVAMLHYNLGGRRLTLYMYDPMKLPLRAQRSLQPRAVGGRAVFVGSPNGYGFAACERHGIGYAVTGELSREESAEIVATIGGFHPNH